MPRPNPARIVAVVGATGAGKTAWIRQQILKAKPRRLLIWDPKPRSEYADLGQPFTSRSELAVACREAGAKGGLRAIYRPGLDMGAFIDRFDWFAKLAYAWGHCTIVAEELAHVTRPGWSPDGWRAVVTLGRSEGLTVYGASQRPALMDKTFLSNASLVHCGRLGTRSDRATMADILDCDAKALALLQPLDFIERADTGETRTGRLSF